MPPTYQKQFILYNQQVLRGAIGAQRANFLPNYGRKDGQTICGIIGQTAAGGTRNPDGEYP